MQVTYFRSQRSGPEMEIETAVAQRMSALFPSHGRLSWAAGSLPVGAGMPDLLFITSEPAVLALAQADLSNAQILAYLRGVGRARVETIVRRLNRSPESVTTALQSLVEAEAITQDAQNFSLTPPWRSILPEVIAIEAKVSNWRQALRQAARNRIFSHRSFIALPGHIADRVSSEPAFAQLGLGILAVGSQGEVSEYRPALLTKPRVWAYYYRIALVAARHVYSDQ
jgi:hypothetical protein